MRSFFSRRPAPASLVIPLGLLASFCAQEYLSSSNEPLDMSVTMIALITYLGLDNLLGDEQPHPSARRALSY